METFSIGALVQLTGISADTLRTWERRYGVPKAMRNASGHRRYTLDTCDFLLLVRRLLEQGARPSEVLKLPIEELRSRVDQHRGGPVSPPPSAAPMPSMQRAQEYCASILLKVEKMDTAGIDQLLTQAWTQLGPQAALRYMVIPLLREVGERWATARLGVHHEHVFSGRLRHFLSGQWEQSSQRSQGPLIAMATPVGEEHELGLHVAATYFALAGARLLFFGPCTPSDALLAGAHSGQADAIAISLSSTYPLADAERYVQELLVQRPPEEILVGGSGCQALQTPCVRLRDEADISNWISGSQRIPTAPPSAVMGAPHMAGLRGGG